MRTDTILLTNENVTLTTYILDSSREMPYMAKRPAVLIFPGGAYKFCSDREAEPIAMAFLAMGFSAFVLRYSLNSKDVFDKALSDAEEALTLIRGKAEEYNILPDKIAVCGFSAGGHLAAGISTLGSTRPNALILGYPCISADICGEGVLCTSVPSLDDKVTADNPPTFLFSTCADTCVPIHSSTSFLSALEKNGVPFEAHIFSDGGHGLALANPVTCLRGSSGDNPDVAKWIALCQSWLYRLFLD